MGARANLRTSLLISVFLLAMVGTAAQAVVIDWVAVGDAGNTADTEVMNDGTTGYGSVSYVYRIGKYEVTNSQYCEFLNAVARTDTYGLYNPNMAGGVWGSGGIARGGPPGTYTYSVRPGRGNNPVNYVSWYDSLRFANWLHNGQPTGGQNSSTTEDGAYTFSGAESVSERNAVAQVFIPSENEWYKVAYYKGGGADAGYWDYATQSDTPPTLEPPPGGNNSANAGPAPAGGHGLTDVGAYVASVSAYGTYDQNGNLTEWNETRFGSNQWCIRGGAWDMTPIAMPAHHRSRNSTAYLESWNIGFRVASVPKPPTMYYVDADAPPSGDGSSWADAFTDLQSALIVAESGDEICVAQGVYTPEDPLLLRRASNPNPADGQAGVSTTPDLSWTAGSDATSHDVYFGTSNPPTFIHNQPATTFEPGTIALGTRYYWRIDEVGAYGTITGTVWSFTTIGVGWSPPSPPPPVDRTATFQLINGVVMKGGYAGFGEPDPNERDPNIYETILSGDIGILGYNSDNSYHVVTGSGCNETAVIDGFTITSGSANGSYPNNNGGGMVNWGGSPTLINCTFIGNSASYDGGGMFNGEQSNPTLTGCTFRGNSSIYEGGAISNRTSSPTITNCSFIDNSSNHGGGISSWPGSPVVSDCTFSGNSAELGGAVFNYDSSSTLTNCIFSNNYAELWGGAICSTIIIPGGQNNSGSPGEETNYENSIPLFADYTFSNNSTDYESNVNTLSESSTLADCKFTGNSAMAGGGVCYIGESNPSLDNCTFGGNSAQIGGAFASSQYTATLTDCTFRGNSGEWGGAFYSEVSSTILINCIFSANTSSYAGAAIHEMMSSSSLYNCLITGNTSSLYGGAMYYWYESSPQMFNCTFAGNSAPVGNAIVCAVPEGYPPLPPSTIRALNCIFWDGGNEIVNRDDSTITVTYSDVQNGYFGTGNIMADPCFVQPEYFGPISYWKLDEAGGTTASDSVGHNHGTLINDPTWATGQISGALSFDGVNDYVDVGNDNSLMTTGDLTISAWIKANKNRACIYSHTWAGWRLGFGIGNNNYDGRLGFYTSSYGHWIEAGNSLADDTWHQVAVTLERNMVRLYTDGFEIGHGIGAPASSLTRNANIGIYNYAWHFGGIIDEVAIYDRALSAEEIRQHYQNGLSGQGYPDAAMPDYHLLPGSPCINAGDPDYIAEPNETDLDGLPRVIAGRIDMGAYEFNHIPVADAGPDQTVEAQAPWGATVTFDGTGSSDADSTPETNDDINDFNWYELDPCDPNADIFLGSGRIIDCNLSIGEHIILLEVIDKAGASDTNEVTLIVQDTTPPDINCPPDVTLECPADTTPSATGKATATDTCGTVTITHSDQWQPGCGNTGTMARTWTATDECGNSSSCLQTLTVVDTTPPEFEFSVTPTMLWPPDHKMVEITPSWTVSDECDASPDVSLISITMNEGDDTVGDGHTTNDIQIGEDGSIYLRSERSGTGSDRIYTITYQAVDDCGNATVRSATVSIPHDFKVLARIASRWLWTNRAGRIPEDLNGDGIVNLKDIAIFANNWIQ